MRSGVVLEWNPPGIAEQDQGCIAPMTIVSIDCNNFFIVLMLGVFLAAMPTASYSSDAATECLVYTAPGENIDLQAI